MRREHGVGLMRELQGRAEALAGTFRAQEVGNTLQAACVFSLLFDPVTGWRWVRSKSTSLTHHVWRRVAGGPAAQPNTSWSLLSKYIHFGAGLRVFCHWQWKMFLKPVQYNRTFLYVKSIRSCVFPCFR
jgi:hypothetical protein